MKHDNSYDLRGGAAADTHIITLYFQRSARATLWPRARARARTSRRRSRASVAFSRFSNTTTARAIISPPVECGRRVIPKTHDCSIYAPESYCKYIRRRRRRLSDRLLLLLLRFVRRRSAARFTFRRNFRLLSYAVLSSQLLQPRPPSVAFVSKTRENQINRKKKKSKR